MPWQLWFAICAGGVILLTIIVTAFTSAKSAERGWVSVCMNTVPASLAGLLGCLLGGLPGVVLFAIIATVFSLESESFAWLILVPAGIGALLCMVSFLLTVPAIVPAHNPNTPESDQTFGLCIGGILSTCFASGVGWIPVAINDLLNIWLVLAAMAIEVSFVLGATGDVAGCDSAAPSSLLDSSRSQT